MTPERKMWLGVISRAIHDVAWEGDERNKEGRYRPEATYKRAAHAWLSGNSKKFRDVCNMAGVDPDFLRENYVSGRLDVKVFCASEDKRKRTLKSEGRL